MDKNEWEYSLAYSINDENVIKRAIKKVIRKLTLFLIAPIIQHQNNVNLQIQAKFETQEQEKNRQIQSLLDDLSKTQDELSETQKNLCEAERQIQLQGQNLLAQQRHFEKMQKDMGAVARQLMRVKWKQIDCLRPYNEKPEDVLTCDICGFSQVRKDYEIKESECIFNGGHLERYVCPQCGVVFGPDKFLKLGQEGIDEDYWVHYLGFKEGDSTDKEIRAFYMLNPDKEHVYLNYGCGSWSKSVEILRNEGYQVYGYEPYAADIDNSYIIGGKDNIKDMRFDGIFSNDLLEHLINPIEDLKFMKSLLLRSESKMAYSTACFSYKYEITRFHTHFFTGNSANVMADAAGLKIVEWCNDIDEHDFICCIFQNNESECNLFSRMSTSEQGAIVDNGMIIPTDALCYGPYLDLAVGKYKLKLEFEADKINIDFRCTSEMGKNTIYKQFINEKEIVLEISIEEFASKVEFVIINKEKSDLKIKEIKFI